MPQSIWQIIEKYFVRKEAWGDPDRMNGLLLLLLFGIRQNIPLDFVVHYGTQGRHSLDSQHPPGNAVDGHFITSASFYKQILLMEYTLDRLQVADRVGLGIYPAWKIPGFHLDVRGHRARWGWIGTRKPDGTMEYCGYEQAKMFAQAMATKEKTP